MFTSENTFEMFCNDENSKGGIVCQDNSDYTQRIRVRIIAFELSRSFRVRIIVWHFRNYEVNSSHCDWKIANHMKIAKQFFAPRKNLSRSTLYFATLYLHFIYPLYTIIKRNIADNQNYIAKCKKRLCNYYFFKNKQ